MKCPFIDPKFQLPIEEPCPICGALGNQEMTDEQYKICEQSSEDDE